MKNILFTLALLVSFNSFGQYDLYNYTYPEGSSTEISKKVKTANNYYLSGNYISAINLFTEIINTYNIYPLVKHNTLYYRAQAYQKMGNYKSACDDIYNAYNIFTYSN